MAAAAGHLDRAERLVREITDPKSRAKAFNELASTIMSLNGSRSFADLLTHESLARRLLAEVIGTPWWQIALPLVARLDGPAFHDVCDLLLARSAVDLNR